MSPASGIYISPHNQSVPAEYRGLGIRLEDDVLLTEDGVEVLTDECPKDPRVLEEIIGSCGS